MPIPALMAVFHSVRPVVPETSAITVQLVMRFIHLVAGILWVGLLYFFNLVNVPFLKGLDSGTRGKIFPGLMSRAMWWFRWSSVVTVFVGFGYWNMIVSADARNAGANGGFAIWTFLLIWTVAAVVEVGIFMSPAEALRRPAVLGLLVAAIVIVASWLYVHLNSHGWESNRLLSIGIGGGMGWFMMFNVWGIVWRVQKKMIRWNTEAQASGAALPPESEKLARVGLLASRVNLVLSFPMLFFMATASHYPFLIQ
jgi:uncharacterized membrane protein